MQECAAYDIADSEVPGEGAFPMRRRSSNPPKVPKVFVTNNCLFDCQYCGMRVSKEKSCRYVNTPREIAEIALKAARNNGHGVFISSSIFRSPDYTEELIIETLRILRRELYYRGYVHAKIMPGADPRLIEQAGWLADRISVNIELSHSDGYASIAKQKKRETILAPMRFIHNKIREYKPAGNRYAARTFARSGQTTQVMAGAMGEDDRQLITLAEALYKKYAMRRVYYSPFSVPSHKPECLPADPTPLWRTRRLYQADRLLQNYGFPAQELLPADQPFLDRDIDPKAAWALRHLHLFPVEVQTADYVSLIQVPGLGVESAVKIIRERKSQHLYHDDLKKMGVWMNRARFFITCNGKYTGNIWQEPADPNHFYTRDCADGFTNKNDLFSSDLLRLLLRDGNGQMEL
jgi:putative DNA modification/repair radical SAM protein